MSHCNTSLLSAGEKEYSRAKKDKTLTHEKPFTKRGTKNSPFTLLWKPHFVTFILKG